MIRQFMILKLVISDIKLFFKKFKYLYCFLLVAQSYKKKLT